MDAGIMDGTSLLFGAVGAVSGTDSVVTPVKGGRFVSFHINLSPTSSQLVDPDPKTFS